MSAQGKRRVLLAALALVCVSSGTAMAAANKLIVKDSLGATDKFVVTDSGSIGVGLGTGVIPTKAIQIKGATGDLSQVITQYVGGGTTNSGGYLAYRNNAGGALPVAGDRIGYMLFGSFATDGVTPKNAAGIVAGAEAAWSSTSNPGYFSFETAAVGATGRTERMRITAAGNVGIGISTPVQKLEVRGGIRVFPVTSATGATIAQPTCTAAIRGTLWLVQGATDSLQICAQSGGTPVWRSITLQ